MSNIKQHTIGELCSYLTKTFGEDYPVAEASADNKIRRQGDHWMGYFFIEDITLTINIQRLLKDEHLTIDYINQFFDYD